MEETIVRSIKKKILILREQESHKSLNQFSFDWGMCKPTFYRICDEKGIGTVTIVTVAEARA